MATLVAWLAAGVTACAVTPTLAQAQPADADPAAVRTVALRLVRFEGGGRSARVVNGIPLPMGWLRAEQVGRVRVVVGGREVPAAVVPLASGHRDGSLRAVLIAFDATIGLDPPEAELQIGRAPTTPRLRPPAPTDGPPAAAVLPARPEYLVSTGLVGATRTAFRTEAMGSVYRAYDARFAAAADRLWGLEGERWEGNYYDRALLYYAAWVRTGRPEYWRRATAVARAYRRDYLEKNDYGTSPHWAQLEGVALHYELTGVEASRTAVARSAWTLGAYMPRLENRELVDARIFGRVLQSAALAWRLGRAAPYTSAAGEAGTADWGARLDEALDKVTRFQTREGRYPTKLGTCGAQQAFMAGILNEALVGVYRTYRPDPRIPGLVRRSVESLWRTEWLPAEGAFRMADGGCPGVNWQQAAPDLNGLIVAPLGWLARVTGDERYLRQRDAIFAGMARAWIAGGKQFNQSYATSYRALADE